MNHAPHLYFAWQQLVEKSQLMLHLASEELWDELIASEMEYVNAVQQIARLTEEIAPLCHDARTTQTNATPRSCKRKQNQTVITNSDGRAGETGRSVINAKIRIKRLW